MELEDKLYEIAEEASASGHNDLAIVLYTYLGSEKVGLSCDFARYCQDYAQRGMDAIDMHKNRRNN